MIPGESLGLRRALGVGNMADCFQGEHNTFMLQEDGRMIKGQWDLRVADCSNGKKILSMLLFRIFLSQLITHWVRYFKVNLTGRRSFEED